MSGGWVTARSAAQAREPSRRCPGVAAVSSSPDDNPLRVAARASSSMAVKLRAGVPASSAISSAQFEAISAYRRSTVVRGVNEAFYQMRPAVRPKYGLFERSAEPIDNPARPHWPLSTAHTTRAQDQDQLEPVFFFIENPNVTTI